MAKLKLSGKDLQKIGYPPDKVISIAINKMPCITVERANNGSWQNQKVFFMMLFMEQLQKSS